jgi:dTDP-glucose pyrophosphorylase
MKAVILAAGKGKRMGSLTSESPKPMLKVKGRPILEHIVTGMVRSAIRDLCIVTGFQAEVVERHFGDGHAFGARICYARQLVQDGTGKAPEYARDFVGTDAFLLAYGDVLVQPETYRQMVARFSTGSFAGLITVIRGQDITKGALGLLDADFCLRRLVEKPTPALVEQLHREGVILAGTPVWYNAGIYIFESLIFDYTARLQKSPRGEYELTDAINAMVNAGLKIAGLEIQGGWVDVRDPQVLAALERTQI